MDRNGSVGHDGTFSEERRAKSGNTSELDRQQNTLQAVDIQLAGIQQVGIQQVGIQQVGIKFVVYLVQRVYSNS
jgi:hypothetical protein